MRPQLITEIGALRGIEAAWWTLWSRQPNATPFSTPSWLIPWWLAFEPGALMCVAIWTDHQLAALAPLYLEQGPLGRRLLPLGISLSDYADILVDPANSAETLRMLTDVLALQAELWDSWSMEEIPEGAATLAMVPPADWSDESEVQSGCPVLTLPGAAGDVRGVVPSTMLRKWRMARHRVDRRIHGVEIADASSVEGMLHELFRLHEARWRTKGQGGVLLDPRVRGFHLRAAPGLLEAGLLRLRSLSIEGRVAAIYYGLQDDRGGYAYLGGFDPDYAFESPGTIMLGIAIEEAISSGLAEFHFLRGQEPYKFAWGATTRWNMRRTLRIRTR